MKRTFKTDALNNSDFYDGMAAIFVGVAVGSLLPNRLSHDLIFFVGMGGYFVFTLLKSWKFGRRDIRERREEHLDALRWRAFRADEKFPVIEDVKRLRDEGRKIEAIKLYRQLNSETGLQEALDAVDLM